MNKSGLHHKKKQYAILLDVMFRNVFYPYSLGMDVWLGLEWVRGEVDGLKLQWVTSTTPGALLSGEPSIKRSE